MFIMILIFILVLAAAIGTIYAGMNQNEENYGQKTKKNLTRLTWFYVIGTICFIGVF
ncbi:hypothetical protein [Brevibacillus massiliensis]|uniref:hypothetical protein n=1 Tax=Brevibacillus massiliensis TaxID=1118054 RepID=UPI00031D33E4|nr:hypothetical protein [Brevibacillus massiliensis]